MSQSPTVSPSAPLWIRPATAGAGLAIWFTLLCVVPDPRPLSAPDSAVGLVRSATGLSEPVARTGTSIALRVAGFGLLGVLTTAALGGVAIRVAVPLGVLSAVVLSVLSQWVCYGYFPVVPQLKISIPSAVIGALVGVALRGSWLALVAIAAVILGLFLWGTSIRTSDDLNATAEQTIQHILAHADEIRPGDEGFADAVHLAFTYAEDNSHNRDPVFANRAAILALGIIFGDDKVATLSRRELDPAWQEQFGTLRQRVTLRGRNDSVRHFWVSAALTTLTDESRATTVGTGKELLDSQPGGSGFSFVDLAANRAGILFALAATRDAESASAIQRFVVGGVHAADFCPQIDDLPEGLTRDQFQTDFGGLGGQRTRSLLAEIDQRMATKAVLRGSR